MDQRLYGVVLSGPRPVIRWYWWWVLCLFCLFAPLSIAASESPADPIIIGLNADLSSQDAQAGESIRRGALVAIDEINLAGGVLGRPLTLEVYDHRRNPARGVYNTRALAEDDNVVAILGGKHTPVVFAELDTIHEYGIPYLIPWAAGTQLVDNNHHPNFVFRVSVRDELAGRFLMQYALAQGYRRPALMLEQTGWGRSNELALVMALRGQGLAPVRTEWFNWGEQYFSSALERIHAAGADTIIFVGNSPDAVQFIRAMQARPEESNLPIISHWGIVGSDFERLMQDALHHINLSFLQTFSFFDPPFPDRAEAFVARYQRLFPDTRGIEDIFAPTGAAHAYDLIHLLARAITLAGTTERAQVRDALERIEYHAGLVRDYAPPFTPSRHDALDITDFRMARFVDGVIMPHARCD
ncbi:branched-chain amino acid transport system substrate-binding protein [Ectothiorhodospira magna]|uniref:Branched-chain amino acid transport system substrate-binding protein n=1 Tax=Ectothiorhodospira magna TaxID=867345 RepID=A0A1H9EQ79_9GAMM|nr:ABC transporter substrate-binding protein [Ectothiorhodospira magna]SEQ27809.1 branched-chain amino acid transport system substrate-binding protein [Ectothiorhodospira magna]